MNRHRRRSVLAAVLATLLAVAVSGSASAGEPYRCEPLGRIEPDAQGRIVSHPAARCTGQDSFKTIEIISGFSVDGKSTGLGDRVTLHNKPAGTYQGKTRSAPNPPGNNLFCANIIVAYWHGLDQVIRQNVGKSCVKY